jgi:hypothetical protein
VTRKLGVFITNIFPSKDKGFKRESANVTKNLCGENGPRDDKIARVQKRADTVEKKYEM